MVRKGLPMVQTIDMSAAEKTVFSLGQKARLSQKDWSSNDIKKRIEMLKTLKNAIYRNRDEIIDLLIHDSGRIRFSAHGLVFEILNTFSISEKARRLVNYRESINISGFKPGKKVYTRFFPYGVIGVIAPANSPFFEAFQQVIPALLMGNTVIVKTPETSPRLTAMIRRLVSESDIPEGVVNILEGGAEEGDALVRSKVVDKVVFFGATDTGRKVIRASAETIKPLFLGLSGAETAIVLKDYFKKRTVEGLVYGAFCHSGQNCSCVRKIYIPAEKYSDFKAAFIKAAGELRMSVLNDYENEIGVIKRKDQIQKLLASIEEAKTQGSIITRLGDHKEAVSRYMPMICENVPEESGLYKGSFVGPYVILRSYDDEEAAVQSANSSCFGLSASVWGTDIQRAENLAHKLQAGTVWINDTQFYHPDVPYGGIKDSGFGKCSGEEGLKTFAYQKTLCVHKKKENNFFWMPYKKERAEMMSKALVFKHDPVFVNRIKAFISMFTGK